MAHLQAQPGLVGQLLQLELPQPYSRSIRTAAVGGDQQLPRILIAVAADNIIPATDRVDGERRRVVVDPDADPAGVGCDIVDPVWRDLAEIFVDQIIHVDGI
ncbi:hypothetical protein HN018_27155 (plasmid) [Lichenicola cladoniae]|uniref:Uncharacterized protein n=1 Tax=Lichenicola cladoniae TaxID=1484109 RepID=A0A6M8I042_9PROT|nr:hypothetical protein HN018_27155 [Lichenicola cladoniae]